VLANQVVDLFLANYLLRELQCFLFLLHAWSFALVALETNVANFTAQGNRPAIIVKAIKINSLKGYVDQMTKKQVVTIRLTNWRHALVLAEQLSGWVFRGQQDATWTLSSTLQRAASLGPISVMLTAGEDQIIEGFQRRAHHFLKDPPPVEDLIDWMALIQHFGGTTRLLDFTESFYVATFFAVERATTECAVWCVDHFGLTKALDAKYKTDIFSRQLPHWQTLYRVAKLAQSRLRVEKNSYERFVFEVQPFRMNERLAVQQGIFLCPLSADVSFLDSLAATFGLEASDFAQTEVLGVDQFYERFKDAKTQEDIAVIKLLLPQSVQYDVLEDLWHMNVTAASLFPGLDGLARSLDYFLRIDALWDIKYKSGALENKVGRFFRPSNL
jgi:FRG domain